MLNNQTEAPKSGRGGARKGAGRPKIYARKITIGLPQKALDIYLQQENKASFIAEAIEYYAAHKAKHKPD